MPGKYENFFKEMAVFFIKEENFQLPDPLVGESRCQERAFYFSDLFKTKKIEDFSEEELCVTGAAYFLTLATRRQYDTFGLMLTEESVSKSKDMAVEFKSNADFNGCLVEARELVSVKCSDKIKNALRSCYSMTLSEAEFKEKCDNVLVAPFYDSVFHSLKFCRESNVPIVLYNVKLQYNPETQRYSFLEDNQLVFIPIGQTYVRVDAEVNKKEPVFFIRSFQIKVLGKPFEDDIGILSRNEVSIEGVLYKLAAIHKQMPVFKDPQRDVLLKQTAALCFSQPSTEFLMNFERDLSAAKNKGLEKAEYIVEKKPPKRASDPISLSIDHIYPSFYRDVLNVIQYVSAEVKKIGVERSDIQVAQIFNDAPDVHKFCKDLVPAERERKKCTTMLSS